MRKENQSLRERRMFAEVRRNAGPGAHQYDAPVIPAEPLPAVREILKAVVNEKQQRRLTDVKDAALLAHARRLMILQADLEREQARNSRPGGCGDGQIEGAALLPQVGRGHVDHQPAVWEFEAEKN